MITATGMRHRASTAFWNMDVSEEDIDCFMEHVGHHRNIDKNIYACPPAMHVMVKRMSKNSPEKLMTDKDMAERSVFAVQFPSAHLQLCLFHILRSFSREVTIDKMGIRSGH